MQYGIVHVADECSITERRQEARKKFKSRHGVRRVQLLKTEMGEWMNGRQNRERERENGSELRWNDVALAVVLVTPVAI